MASILIVAALGCSETPERLSVLDEVQPTLIEDLAQLEMMKAEILDFIGEPSCSQVSECAAIAFGSKPCGGPWTYLVYSKTTVDAEDLQDMVDEYNAFNDIVNRRHRIWSNCAFVGAPTLECVEMLCVGLDSSL